jgi:hypothetical protein
MAVAWTRLDWVNAVIVVAALQCPVNQERVLYVIVGIRDTGTE